MILENKFIRIKRQRQRLITIIFIVFFLCVFVGVLLFTNTRNNTQFEIKDFMSLSGVLKEDNNYPLYTHALVLEDSITYLKSSVINLNELDQQNVFVGGNVDGSFDKKPIIDVSVIQSSDYSYILRNGKYIFPSNYFLIDTAQDANLTVVKDSNDIQVYYAGNLAFEVNSFICNKVIPDQDCAGIRKKLVNEYVKTFTSPHGYQFYQSSDTIRYVLDKESPLAYVFTVPDEEDIINLSYIFRPIDGKFITTLRKDLLEYSCLDEREKLVTVDEILDQNIKGDKFLQVDLTLKIDQEISDDKVSLISKECSLLIDIYDIALRAEIDFN